MVYIIWLLRAAALFLLILAASQDYKSKEASNICTGGFCIACSLSGYLSGFTMASFAALCICILFLSLDDVPVFGGADGAVYSGLMGALGFCAMPVVLFVPSVLALIVYAVEGKTRHYRLTRPISEVDVSGKRGIVLLPIIAMSIPLIAALMPSWYIFVYETFCVIV